MSNNISTYVNDAHDVLSMIILPITPLTWRLLKVAVLHACVSVSLWSEIALVLLHA